MPKPSKKQLANKANGIKGQHIQKSKRVNGTGQQGDAQGLQNGTVRELDQSIDKRTQMTKIENKRIGQIRKSIDNVPKGNTHLMKSGDETTVAQLSQFTINQEETGIPTAARSTHQLILEEEAKVNYKESSFVLPLGTQITWPPK